jgi:hypothetical protein
MRGAQHMIEQRPDSLRLGAVRMQVEVLLLSFPIQ